MTDKNDSKKDLLELYYYLKNKYNIETTIDKPKNVNYLKDTKDAYIRLFFLFLLIIILCIIYIILKKYLNKYIINNIFINIFFNIIFIIIFLYILNILQIYIFNIYYYHNVYLVEQMNTLKHNNIQFNTGDILQEVINWNNGGGFLYYIVPLKFFHNLFIFKFNNKDYVLHYRSESCGYPYNILTLGKHIEICMLEDYLRDNYHATRYYRLFKINKPINNDKIFNFLKNLDINNLKFYFLPCFVDCPIDNNYNCMGFILKLLISINILPEFNYHNITPDNLVSLPKISKNVYDEPFIMEVKTPENH